MTPTQNETPGPAGDAEKPGSRETLSAGHGLATRKSNSLKRRENVMAGRDPNHGISEGLRSSACSLWIHRGPGHYIGSMVLVCAENKSDAESLIRNELDKCGLKNEPLEVTQAVFSKNSVIVCEDGAY